MPVALRKKKSSLNWSLTFLELGCRLVLTVAIRRQRLKEQRTNILSAPHDILYFQSVCCKSTVASQLNQEPAHTIVSHIHVSDPSKNEHLQMVPPL